MKLVKQTTMRFSFEVRTDNDRALLVALALLWFVNELSRGVREDLKQVPETLKTIGKITQIAFISIAFGLNITL